MGLPWALCWVQGSGETVFSHSVWGQGRDQELGAEGDGGDTSPKGGEVLFYIHQRTNWMALAMSNLLVRFLLVQGQKLMPKTKLSASTPEISLLVWPSALLFSLRDGWGLQSMLRKGGALRGHSDAVLMYQNGCESFHNHTAVDIRAGTGDKGWWFLVSGTGFSGVQILVLLACAGSEMHPSSGHRERRLMNTSKTLRCIQL